MARKLSLEGIMGRTEEPPDGNGEPVDDQAEDGANGQSNGKSRGPLRATKPTRAKKGRLKDGEKLRGCKLSIPESIFERLRQQAIKRKISMSVLAAEVLDSKLPYFTVTSSEKPPADD
ncbi:MAG: hypothetical protein ACHRXM_26450 [Isosphaerales bacterium]